MMTIQSMFCYITIIVALLCCQTLHGQLISWIGSPQTTYNIGDTVSLICKVNIPSVSPNSIYFFKTVDNTDYNITNAQQVLLVFANSGRYQVQLDMYDDPDLNLTLPRGTLTITGFQYEDDGLYTCRSGPYLTSTQSLEVIVPITQLWIASIDSNGVETNVSNMDVITLKTGENSGVACYAFILNSTCEDIVKLTPIITNDVDMNANNFIRSVKEQYTTVDPAGFFLTSVLVKITFTVTNLKPDHNLNGQTLTCKGYVDSLQTRQQILNETVQLAVQFPPLWTCQFTTLYARVNGLVQSMMCNLMANPAPVVYLTYGPTGTENTLKMPGTQSGIALSSQSSSASNNDMSVVFNVTNLPSNYFGWKYFLNGNNSVGNSFVSLTLMQLGEGTGSAYTYTPSFAIILGMFCIELIYFIAVCN